jgi:hypothetical protein
VSEGRAYHCGTAHRLRAEREQAAQQRVAWQYDRACFRLSEDRLAALVRALDDVVPFDEAAIDDAIRGTAARLGISGWAPSSTPCACRHRSHRKPWVFEVLALLGREQALGRLRELLDFLTARKA